MRQSANHRTRANALRAADSTHLHLTQISVGPIALLFLLLLLFISANPYAPFELQITRAVQSFHPSWFDTLMRWTSDFGFYPQVVVWIAILILVLWALGYRWEALGVLFAAVGNALLETIVKSLVIRPRPHPDQVHVFRILDNLTQSFPAGHVMANVAIMGFLIYLLLRMMRPSVLRTLVFLFLSSQIALIGVSRIYEGEHWFTDVLGGYLLGLLLLAATISFYRWGQSHFPLHRPSAQVRKKPA